MVDDGHEDVPTEAALSAARRRIAAAEKHERAALRHDEYARFLDEKNETEQADVERRNAMLERDAANDELERAVAIQGPTQLTEPKGYDEDGKPHEPMEIPIPSRGEFLHNLEKVAPKPKSVQDDSGSSPRRPTLDK